MKAKHEGRLRFTPFARHRWAHCHFPRAGSWSFRDLYRTLYGEKDYGRDHQTKDELADLQRVGWLVSWFVRDPIARFTSVFKYFALLEDRFKRTGTWYATSPQMRKANTDGRLFESIDTFAERAFNSFPRDKHIALQTGWGAECADFIAPLERSATAWRFIRARAAEPLPPMPWKNATGDAGHWATPWQVRQFYDTDITYHRKVCAEFNSKELQACWPNMDGEARRP
jgi:hypothetical protein